MTANSTETSDAPYFEVGAVSKITGLSPNTLRTWERRKFIEASSRSATGRRRYSQEQVESLALMKKLTNMGDAISSIAKLTLPALRDRLLEYQTRHTEISSDRSSVVRVAPVGQLAKTWVSILPPKFKIVSEESPDKDLLLVGLDATTVECRRKVSVASLENPDTTIALLYDYTSRELLQQFANEGKFLIRVPCSPEMLAHYLHAALANASHQADPVATSRDLETTPRLFTDKQLATIASSNPNIKCECPHHISALVSSLASFENYCRRCEIESPQDKDLHVYLGSEISRARSIVEEALLYLCQKDNLQIPQDRE